MSKLIKILIVVCVGLSLFVQIGAARDFADIYTECGLGAMIAPRNGTVAAITNVTWDLGTTAVSSNITCPSACNGEQEKVASFIYESYDSLEKDLAKGKGEYLDSLMSLIEYDSKAKDHLISNLRSGFKDTVSQPDYVRKTQYQKAETLYHLVYKHVDNIS